MQAHQPELLDRVDGAAMKRVLASVLVTGCTSNVVQSALVETKNMSTRYEIVTESDGKTTASATYLWTTGEMNVVFDARDGDTASIDGIALTDDVNGVYTVEVANVAEHVFVLERAGMARIEHRGQRATPFTITSAPITGTYDVAAMLTWNPADPEHTVDIVALGAEARCPSRTLARSHPDTGSFAFTGADVKPQTEPPPPCTFSLEVIRELRVMAEPSGFANVSITSQHVTATTLSLH
jgi:hypothetical protein